MSPRELEPDTVQAKLHLLEELLAALDGAGPVTAERLRTDTWFRLALERMLTHSVDTVVAVCSHVVGAHGGTPTTYRAAVAAAGELGLVEPALASSLVAAVGMRNLLVHEYARADLDRVAAAVQRPAGDLRAFVQQVARWLVDRTG